MTFILEPAADSPTHQKQAHWIPLLSKQLNKLDSTFQLSEGTYTFKHELRARDILETAYAEYISSSSTPDQPHSIILSSSTPSPCLTSSAVQVGSSRGRAGCLGDAVIDITLAVNSGNADGREVNNSEVIVSSEQIL
jgi:hypothetical protein